MKNILDKFDYDYHKLRIDNENINLDNEMEIYYDSDGLYELYSRNWRKCVLALSHIIRNVDLS